MGAIVPLVAPAVSSLARPHEPGEVLGRCAYPLGVVFARNMAILALVALAIELLPGGGPALDLFLTFISIAFFVAIAFFGYRLFRENSFTLNTLEVRQKVVLYGSIGGALLTFTASQRLFSIGGLGLLVWLALIAFCSFGVYWALVMSRRSY